MPLSIHSSQVVRPLRIGFIVRPNNSDLKKAVSFSTKFWGSDGNVLIPYLKRVDKRSWPSSTHLTGRDILRNTIERFDVDLILCDKADYDDFKCMDFGRRLLAYDDVHTDEYGHEPGISADFVLEAFCREEYKYIRHDAWQIVIPVGSFATSPLGLSLLGAFGTSRTVQSSLLKANAFDKTYNINEYYTAGFSRERVITPRKIANRDLTPSGGSLEQRQSVTLFFLDSRNWTDIIDFVNIRVFNASPVLPIPVNMYKLIDTEILSAALAGLWPAGQFLAVKSRRTSDDLIYPALNAVNQMVRQFGSQFTISQITEYWLPVDRKSDVEVYPKTLYHRSEHSTDELQNKEGKYLPVRLDVLSPSVIRDSVHSGTWGYAAEFSLTSTWNEGTYAITLPKCDLSQTHMYYGYSALFARRTDSGIVVYSGGRSETITLNLPESNYAICTWLQQLGYEDAKTSTAGLLTSVIRKKLGFRGLLRLTNDSLIKLMSKHENDDYFPYQEALIAVKKFKLPDERTPSDRIQELCNLGIISLGITLQCPTCRRRTWYTVDQLSEEVHCKFCFSENTFPTYPLKMKDWAYRFCGPFHAMGMASGAYSTLLTAGFFTRISHCEYTYIPGVDIGFPSRSVEVDLVMFFRWESSLPWKPNVLIISECKTHGDLSARDLEKTAFAAKTLNADVICAATLKDSFTDEEKNLIKQYLLSEQPDSLNMDVLLFTRKELCNGGLFDFEIRSVDSDLHEALNRSWKDRSFKPLATLLQTRYLS